MANVILPEQTFEGFFNNDGIYMGPMAVIALEPGKTYSVFWDGTEYKCTAGTTVVDGAEVIGFGNLAILGSSENTGEPFLIGIMADGSGAAAYTTDTAASHTVAIYTADTGFVLKDRTGKAETYDVDVVRFQTPDGSTQTFAKGEIVTDVPIVLDFSEGDQTINAPEGALVKSALIHKPDTLVPENIAKDVEVAGVVGTHEGAVVLAEEKDVNFFDYDGSLLYSYTTEEVATLTALPPLPEHEGLICQEWNWSLSNIKAQPGAVNVGATYITDDGSTRIYVDLPDGATNPSIYLCVNGTLTVKWGDGTSTTVTGTSLSTMKTVQHSYNTFGKYVIALKVNGQITFASVGDNNAGSPILRFNSSSTATEKLNELYNRTVKKIELGNNVLLNNDYTFSNLAQLETITIPKGMNINKTMLFYLCRKLQFVVVPSGGTTALADSMFYSCYALKGISIPKTVTTLLKSVFAYCYSLKHVVLPYGVTSIGDQAFRYCHSLEEFVMPNSVTSVGTVTFNQCYNLHRATVSKGLTTIPANMFSYTPAVYYDFLEHTSVPTLSSTTAFDSTSSNSKIRVPSALLSRWKSASNWSTFASRIVGGS